MGSWLCQPSVMLMGAAGWHSWEFLVVFFFFFFFSPPPFQRLTREHLLKDKIKKPMVVYFEDSVFAFTSCWRE